MSGEKWQTMVARILLLTDPARKASMTLPERETLDENDMELLNDVFSSPEPTRSSISRHVSDNLHQKVSQGLQYTRPTGMF
jgi:hypothetical protein